MIELQTDKDRKQAGRELRNYVIRGISRYPESGNLEHYPPSGQWDMYGTRP